MACLELLAAAKAESPVRFYMAAAVLLAALFMSVCRIATPRVHPQEPPLVKPRIPLVGHIVGLLTEKSQYFVTL